MTKPNFTFHFQDEPQFRANSPRQTLANNFRSYRKHPDKYAVKRIGLHRYTVQMWHRNSPIAIIEINSNTGE